MHRLRAWPPATSVGTSRRWQCRPFLHRDLLEPEIKPLSYYAESGPRARHQWGSLPFLYRRRLVWAALLARVFAVDVTLCPACGGRLRLIAVLSDPASIRSYLGGVGLAADLPALPAAPGV